ncbi:2,3-bisphosphoglycerate-independent phosphoglycerate mutase [Patescibacteria group bacterium]|nr:2,3-bisphosphoglycerate-independent phosphoglycerate mutase [Patescibacteria group bacterium]
MKILLIIIDGLGDAAVSELGNKTPLEAAKTPNLDFFAKNGICGLVEPFKFDWQEEPESDTCHLALFGYDPKKHYLGRGVYEAVGIGMKMKEGDVAFRVNFATVDKNLKIIDRRAGRISGTEKLVKALQGLEIDEVKFFIKKSYGHRAGLILRCLTPAVKHLSSKVSDGDSHKDGVRVKQILPLDSSPEAKFTARVLNKFLEKAHHLLKNHSLNKKREKQGLLPANYLLLRGAGQFKKIPRFKEKYNLKAGCIAGGGLYKGIAKILGMNLIRTKGATGLPDTNLKGKFLTAKRALKEYDFVFLHIKAADSLAEDGNFLGKKDFIERLDRDLKPLLNLKNTLIVVTGDHSTCSNLKKHCSEPIPILIAGPGIKADGVKKFSEKNCQKGTLGRLEQLDLMPRILEFAENYKK